MLLLKHSVLAAKGAFWMRAAAAAATEKRVVLKRRNALQKGAVNASA